MSMRWACVLGSAAALGCGSSAPTHDEDGGSAQGDTGVVVADWGTLPADRFVTEVISFTRGACSGYGVENMPRVVEGPPMGAGADQGSTDVVSLGNGGEIVLSFQPNAIVDGDGVDFIVFENAFFVDGDPNDVYAEPGEVSVSDDGVTWTSFPCTRTTRTPPYGSCAGWHPVYSNPDNDISPVDPKTAGGDGFDLADIGVKHARYVRIVDKIIESCPEGGGAPIANGFDLDAIAIVNAESP
jgi:hypothetical protein